MRLLLKFALVSLAIGAAPRLSDDIVVDTTGSAMLAAVVFGVLFVFVGWLITAIVGLLSIVPGIFTFGLFFLLVPTLVNMVLLKFTAGLMGSFDIRSWSSAFFLSLAIGFVNWVFEKRKSD